MFGKLSELQKVSQKKKGVTPMKKMVLFLVTFVMLCTCTCCAFASDMDVRLERAHIHLEEGDELVELDTWLDSQVEVLGYRPKWDVMVWDNDIGSSNIAIISLNDTLVEVEVLKGDDSNPLVPKKALSQLIIEENELISKYPDGGYYKINSIDDSQNEYLNLVAYRTGDGIHFLVIEKDSKVLIKELVTEDYQLKDGETFVGSSIYRQLRYYMGS